MVTRLRDFNHTASKRRLQRTIIHRLDNNPITIGTQIVLVPLKDGDNPPYAILNQTDFDTLMDLGCSGIWHINRDGNVSLWFTKPKRIINVARLIMDAGPGEGVYNKDRDKLNLRKNNLVLADRVNALRRERDYIPTRQLDYSRTRHDWEYIVQKPGITTRIPQPIKHYDTPYGVQFT